MSMGTLIGLLNNVALLLTLGLLYDVLMTQRKAKNPMRREILTGLILGAIGFAVMVNPWNWTEGIIFDTRTVLLSVSGLVFGGIPTAIAMVITAAYRSYLGGAGVWMGIATIVSSGGIGLIWRRRLRKDLEKVSLLEWYLLGLTVHLIMVVCMFLLPAPVVKTTMIRIGIPVLIIFPVGTALLGKVMSARHARLRSEELLREQSAQLAALSANVPGIVFQFLLRSDGSRCFLFVSDGCRVILGIEPAEVLADPQNLFDAVHPDDRAAFTSNLSEVFRKKKSWHWEGRCLSQGRTIWIQGAASPRQWGEEGFLWDGMMLDVTARKKAEEERELLQGQLFQSQKNRIDWAFSWRHCPRFQQHAERNPGPLRTGFGTDQP